MKVFQGGNCSFRHTVDYITIHENAGPFPRGNYISQLCWTQVRPWYLLWVTTLYPLQEEAQSASTELHLLVFASSALRNSSEADGAAPSTHWGQYSAELQLPHRPHAGRLRNQSFFWESLRFGVMQYNYYLDRYWMSHRALNKARIDGWVDGEIVGSIQW